MFSSSSLFIRDRALKLNYATAIAINITRVEILSYLHDSVNGDFNSSSNCSIVTLKKQP